MPKKKGSSRKPTQQESKYPKITILTPIYNRTRWLPLMIANVCSFDYVKKDLTWFILDSKDALWTNLDSADTTTQKRIQDAGQE